MSHIIAVDFGGTNIRVADFDAPKPPPRKQTKTPTKASEGPAAVLDRLAETIEALLPEDRSGVKIGIGAPGPLNPREGIVYEAPNLKGWSNIPLRSHLEERLGVPIAIGNDANLAALGEARFGAGVGIDDLVYLTISTGIGGGVISAGRLLLGANGLAAELGHTTYQPDGPLCGCGVHGHLEAMASGTSIARRAEEALQSGESSTLREAWANNGRVTTIEIGRAALAGDPLAMRVIEQAGAIIGHKLADFAHIFNPRLFILGGGVSQLGPLFFEPIERSLHAHIMHPKYLKGLRVVPAALGDDSGLFGAMALAQEELP